MLFNLHTHISESNAIINIDDFEMPIQKGYFYSLGNHPYKKGVDINLIEERIKETKQIVAIGECGIDLLKGYYPLETQIAILKQHVYLSEKLQKPLILHVVKGYNEIIQLKNELQSKQPWVIHGFNKYKITDNLIKNGFYLSFGKALLTNEKLQERFLDVPLDKCFLETDSAEVSIKQLYYIASVLKKTPIETLEKQMIQNVNRVFNQYIL